MTLKRVLWGDLVLAGNLRLGSNHIKFDAIAIGESPSQYLSARDIDFSSFEGFATSTIYGDNYSLQSAASDWLKALNQVGKVVVSSPVTDIDFTSLDVNTHEVYYLLGILKNNLGSVSSVSLYFNGDVTATNYYLQWINANNAARNSARQNNAALYNLGANAENVFLAVIKRTPNNQGFALVMGARDLGSGVIWQNSVLVKVSATANITSIKLRAGTANAFAADTTVYLMGVKG